MKKIISLILAVLMLCVCLTGCGNSNAEVQIQENAAEELRQFTDDLGRTVAVPVTVDKIAVSGPLTQVYVFPLCPELFAGFSNAFASDIEKYFPAEYLSLPELGQLYGGKGTMDLEALLAADPDVVIDVGDAKSNMAEDLDALTEQTGIPFVHINANEATAAEAYLRLGELTGKTEKAQELSDWCRENYDRVADVMAKVDADGARKSLVYCLGDKGLNVLAEGSFHAGTINLVSDNAAKLSEVSFSGDGNEIDMEQLILWNPEVIVFEPNSVYDTAGADPVWQELDAIKNGEYYRCPWGPYGWLSTPPGVQRYLGMVWLTALLYPEYVDYDLQELVTEYYQVFYGYELSDAEYKEMTQESLK